MSNKETINNMEEISNDALKRLKLLFLENGCQFSNKKLKEIVEISKWIDTFSITEGTICNHCGLEIENMKESLIICKECAANLKIIDNY